MTCFDTIISIKTTTGASFRFLSYLFAMSEVRVHLYVSYSQSLESNKNFCLQYSFKIIKYF